MKKIHLIVTVFCFLTLTYSQNNSANQVDLKELFRKQVESIQKRNNQSFKSKKELINNLPQTAKVVKKSTVAQKSPIKKRTFKVVKKSQSLNTTISSVPFKAFLLFEASLLASIIVMYRRKKVGFKKAISKELKENIGLLRKEKLEVEPDDKLVKVRRNLTAKKLDVKKGTSSIAYLAKKFSIAKGEVHLAIKLNLMAGK